MLSNPTCDFCHPKGRRSPFWAISVDSALLSRVKGQNICVKTCVKAGDNDHRRKGPIDPHVVAAPDPPGSQHWGVRKKLGKTSTGDFFLSWGEKHREESVDVFTNPCRKTNSVGHIQVWQYSSNGSAFPGISLQIPLLCYFCSLCLLSVWVALARRDSRTRLLARCPLRKKCPWGGAFGPRSLMT